MMARGINIGNTLEPPTEGGWNNGPVQEYYFDDYVAAGFTCVRIPIRWDNHTGQSPPYAVAASWMDRVEQVVDWGLERGLFIIINGHHEDWLKNGYADPALRARYDSIWVQISERFSQKSDRLLFEIINEPYGMTRQQVDELNVRILGLIRETNPTRIVVYSGNEWSGSATMMAAAVPDDDWVMAYFHSYDPWSFAGEGQGTWGSASDRAGLAQQFQAVANWSASAGIPVMISEFGAVHQADYNSRMAHYAAYVDHSLTHGIAFQAWDDGGNFGVYERGPRTWNEVKDILVKSFVDGPTLVGHEVRGDSVVVLSWTNRSAAYDGLRVEVQDGDGDFAAAALLPGDATAYEDTTVGPGQTVTYRVVALEDGHPDRVSYPHRAFVAPWQRSGFHGGPLPIPGTIEAEDFDVGGEGLTYHDADPVNTGGAYRPGDGVDIEARLDGGFHVGWVEIGEWLEYAVDVAAAGSYELTAHVAAMAAGGVFRFEIGSVRSSLFIAPGTGSWQTTTPVTKTITLAAGEQIMRVSILNTPQAFNLDRFVLVPAGSTAIGELPDAAGVALYPDPVGAELTLALDRAPGPYTRAELVNILGQIVRRVDLVDSVTRLSTEGLPAGLYLVRILEPFGAGARRTVVVL